MEEVDTLWLEYIPFQGKPGEERNEPRLLAVHIPVHAPGWAGMYENFQLIHGIGVTVLPSF